MKSLNEVIQLKKNHLNTKEKQQKNRGLYRTPANIYDGALGNNS